MRCNNLYKEHCLISATLRACERVDKKGLVTLDKQYQENMKKRLVRIEGELQNMLK